MEDVRQSILSREKRRMRRELYESTWERAVGEEEQHLEQLSKQRQERDKDLLTRWQDGDSAQAKVLRKGILDTLSQQIRQDKQASEELRLEQEREGLRLSLEQDTADERREQAQAEGRRSQNQAVLEENRRMIEQRRAQRLEERRAYVEHERERLAREEFNARFGTSIR